MSDFRVQLDDANPGNEGVLRASKPVFSGVTILKPMPKRPFVIVGMVLVTVILAGVIGGLVYYWGLRETPQYSLALLIDAAKRDDKADIDSLIDTNAVIDDFVPQVTGKAIEMYGRGQRPETLAQIAKIAEPILPAVKERAGAELPRVIRERTERFGYVPFFAMVMGADRYLEIAVNGNTALVRSKLADHPLEMTMRKNGSRWQIVGVTDEQLATDIARKIGQEIIAIASTGDARKAVNKFGIGNLSDLLKQAEELVR
jgi:hypothetical protein